MADQDREPALLGRFANAEATTEVPLGPCRCPGTPHDTDTATVRADIGEGERWEAINRGGFNPFTGVVNGPAGDNECVATFTTAWTLQDDGGETVPITAANIRLLDADTRNALLEAVDAGFRARRALPNVSAAPSRASRRASASRARKSRTAR